VKKLIGLRHQFPILRRARFLSGEYNEDLGVKDVTWVNTGGEEMRQDQWDDPHTRVFGMLLDGRAQETGIRRRGELATLLLVVNAWHEMIDFRLPQPPGGDAWVLRLDTVRPGLPDHQVRYEVGEEYSVTGRSLLLFQLT